MDWQGLWYGRQEKAIAGPLRWALRAAEVLFGAGVRARGWLYEKGLLESRRVDGVRVISVGDINVGGTGKTPAVICLARQLLSQGLQVAVVSRGYGRASRAERSFTSASAVTAAEVGDEPLLISRKCPGAVVWVGRDRVSLCRRARDESGAQVVLLDDGFQHRALERDLEIVTVDEAVGLGNGHLLPRGPLREPTSALGRAQLLWVRVAEGTPAAPLPPFRGPIVRATYRSVGARLSGGERMVLAALKDLRVVAVSGIARPSSFQRQIESLGAKVVCHFSFADHHIFTPEEVETIRREATRANALVLTTEKDQTRLPVALNAWGLEMETEVVSGTAALESALISDQKT